MGGLIVATTHYTEIKNFAERHADFIPAAMAFDNETLTPKYQLQLGQVGASQALWIARKMQITPAIVQRAAHYINHADYQLDKIEFKNITQKSTQKKNTRPLFKRGDRVLVKTNHTPALIFKDEDEMQDTLLISQDDEIKEVLKKRIELITPATELYPAGYNLDNLFGKYSDRKKEHDLLRGAKSAQKQLDQEIRARRKAQAEARD